jgi:hypothetical protein
VRPPLIGKRTVFPPFLGLLPRIVGYDDLFIKPKGDIIFGPVFLFISMAKSSGF